MSSLGSISGFCVILATGSMFRASFLILATGSFPIGQCYSALGDVEYVWCRTAGILRFPVLPSSWQLRARSNKKIHPVPRRRARPRRAPRSSDPGAFYLLHGTLDLRRGIDGWACRSEGSVTAFRSCSARHEDRDGGRMGVGCVTI